MEAFDTFCFITGIISVGIGILELVTKKLVGRDTAKIPEAKCRQFLPYDILTYILAGILMVILGQSSRISYLQSSYYAVPILVLLAVLILALNIYFANRILGRRR